MNRFHYMKLLTQDLFSYIDVLVVVLGHRIYFLVQSIRLGRGSYSFMKSYVWLKGFSAIITPSLFRMSPLLIR